MTENIVIAIAFAVVVFAITCFVGFNTKTLLPSIVAFVLHGTVTILLYSFEGFVSADAAYYDLIGQQISSGYDTSSVTSGKEGWPIILGGLYWAFGHMPLLGLVVNVAAVASTVSVLGATAHLLGLPRAKTAWIMAILPTAFLWGGLLLREALCWLLISILCYTASKLATQRDSRFSWLGFGAAFIGLLWVRGTVALIVAGALVLALVYVRRRASVVVWLGAIGLLLAAGPLATKIQSITGTYTLEQVNASREALSDNAGSAFPVVNFSSVEDYVTVLPVQFMRAAAGPFPWEWASLGILYAVEGVIWLGFALCVLRGMRRTRPWRSLTLLIFPSLMLIAVLAFTSGNYGTMLRLRVQAQVLLVPIAAAGVFRTRTIDDSAVDLRSCAKGSEGVKEPMKGGLTNISKEDPRRLTRE